MNNNLTAYRAARAGAIGTLLLAAAGAFAQAPPPAKSLAASAGVFAYPEKKQTPAQQSQDEAECFNWAKTQSGYDPMQPPPAAAPAPPSGPVADGSRARGALRGAAGGAAIGAIAGDAGKGAAIGAVAGTMAGGRQSRISQQQKQEQAVAQTQANVSQLQGAFKQGMGVCLQAKGYAVK